LVGWSLVVDHWSLVVGRWSLVVGRFVGRRRQRIMASSSPALAARMSSMVRSVSSLPGTLAALALAALFYGACGSSGTPSMTAMTGPGCAAVAALTPEQIRKYTNAQIAELGTSIKCLSDAALGVLS